MSESTAPVVTGSAPTNDAPIPEKAGAATKPKQAMLQVPISLEEIKLVQGLGRAQRKLWAKRVADQIYKLVRGYQPVPAGYEPIPDTAPTEQVAMEKVENENQ